ncbi:MAG: ATP-dependent Clp protease adaptor ClpS [Planctomycetes bacterium]|nr:ATP-dependent Clp protease adaptor ClpS [Planctomycetota bacterium]MCL4731794.1 ATP-dependent Clp protease adaptor ClpS [Planctomycetota bacterium]
MPDDTPTGKAPEEPHASSSTWGDESTVIAPKAKVVFFDDDRTPVDFVLHLLEHYLGFDEAGARATTERIRASGSAVVAELLPPIAENTVRKMEAAVRAGGYPFRMEIQEQGDAA